MAFFFSPRRSNTFKLILTFLICFVLLQVFFFVIHEKPPRTSVPPVQPLHRVLDNYDVVIDLQRAPTVNILYPCCGVTGGGKAIFYLARCLSRAGIPTRILNHLTYYGETPPKDAIDGVIDIEPILADIREYVEFTGVEKPLQVHPKDLFMATWCRSWSLVSTLQKIVNPSQLPLYFVQDDEHWLCQDDPYNDPHFAIFNGPPLNAWFEQKKIGIYHSSLPKSFDPAMNRHLALAALAPKTVPTATEFSRKKEKGKNRMLVYFREQQARNRYREALAALYELVTTNVLDPADWEFLGVGEPGKVICDWDEYVAPLKDQLSFFGTNSTKGACLEELHYMNRTEYDNVLQLGDVAISLCDSGGVSWPIMDFATRGVVTVTNSVTPNHDEFFSSVSPLIHISPTLSVADLVQTVKDAVVMAESLSGEQIASYVKKSAARFPADFCAEGCFDSKLVESLEQRLRP